MSTLTGQNLRKEMACLHYHHHSSLRSAVVSGHVFAPSTIALSHCRAISYSSTFLSRRHTAHNGKKIDFGAAEVCPTGRTTRICKEDPSSTRSRRHHPLIDFSAGLCRGLGLQSDRRLGLRTGFVLGTRDGLLLGTRHGLLLGTRHRLLLGSRQGYVLGFRDGHRYAVENRD
jgi:hypothetical protein